MADYVFTAQASEPDGIRVTVTIRIPNNGEATIGWRESDIRDVAEFAQGCAGKAMHHTLASRQHSREEPPF